MASLLDFMANVLPYASGCSYPLAEQHIRQVCIDFCTHAPIAQVNTDPVDVVAGQVEYDIDTPAGCDVTIVLEAVYGTRPLKIWKTGDINFAAARAQLGEPTGIKQAADNTFTLDLTPQFDAPGAIGLLIATRPNRKTVTVADVLLDYAFEIGQGVVGRLLMIPGHEFSNPELAGTYTRNYERARTEARIRAETSFGSSSTRVQPRRFQ